MKVQVHLSFEEYIRRGNLNTEGLLSGGHPLMGLISAYYWFFADELWADEQPIPQVPMFLSVNAFTLWTSGVRVALSGHETAVYPLFRTALESACYSLLILHRSELASIWVERHNGEGQRKACRKAFISAVSDAAKLVAASEAGSGAYIAQLYEASIDFGAHPNPRSVMNHVHRWVPKGGEEKIGLGSIYPGDSLPVFRALTACIEYGRGIALLLAHCLPDMTPRVIEGFRALEQRQSELFPENVGDSA